MVIDIYRLLFNLSPGLLKISHSVSFPHAASIKSSLLLQLVILFYELLINLINLNSKYHLFTLLFKLSSCFADWHMMLQSSKLFLFFYSTLWYFQIFPFLLLINCLFLIYVALFLKFQFQLFLNYLFMFFLLDIVKGKVFELKSLWCQVVFVYFTLFTIP